MGKTELLVRRFADIGEVIAVDSIQVYKGLDIGSAKPSAAERALIPHHLIDIRDPEESFDAGDFCREAETACQDILLRGKVPILSGGTAFYFKNFLMGLPALPPSDPLIRAKVSELFDSEGEEAFRERLKKVDGISWQRIAARDHYRLKRAYEVWLGSGRALSEFPVPGKLRSHFKPLILGLQRPREDLAERIGQRVDAMMGSGLLDEIRTLLNRGYDEGTPAMKAIGYAEFLPWLLQGTGSLESAVQQVKLSSRRYAKRQMTFFRSLPEVEWLHPDDEEALITRVRDFLK